jgi:hypothetical protein
VSNPSNGISDTAEKLQCSLSKVCLITDQLQANNVLVNLSDVPDAHFQRDPSQDTGDNMSYATVVLVVAAVVLVVTVVVKTTMFTSTSISLYLHMLKVYCDTQFSFPCVLIMASAYHCAIMVTCFYEVCRDYNHV